MESKKLKLKFINETVKLALSPEDKPSMPDIKRLAESFSNLMEEYKYSEADVVLAAMRVFEPRGIVFTLNVEDPFIPMHKEASTPALFAVMEYLDPETGVQEKKRAIKYVPTHVLDTKIGRDTFGVSKFNGEWIMNSGTMVVEAHDTGNKILKTHAKKDYRDRYFEKEDSLIEYERRPGEVIIVYKYDVVTTVDTNDTVLRDDVYNYRRPDGHTEYYKYRSLSPDAPRRVFFYNETKKTKITGRMFGVEYEYENAIDLTRKIFVDKTLRDKFESVRDGSLPNADTESAEIVSVPLSLDQMELALTPMDIAMDTNAFPSESCGFHVHVSASDLTHKDIVNVVNFAKTNETNFFKLVNSDRVSNRYCRLLDERFNGFKDNRDEDTAGALYYNDSSVFQDRQHLSKWSQNRSRHYWLNLDRIYRFRNKPNAKTVEFRMHHATHDKERFRKFILLCYHVIDVIKNNPKIDWKTASLFDITSRIKDTTVSQELKSYISSSYTKERYAKPKTNTKKAALDDLVNQFRTQQGVRTEQYNILEFTEEGI